MDHEGRIALARRVTEYVRRHHPDVVAVCIHGSVAHGEDREFSDLEMSAFTREEPEVHAYTLIHEGVLIELEFMSEEDALKKAAKVTAAWPVAADGWVHTLATYDPGGLMPRLAALAGNPDAAQIPHALRLAMQNFFEDLCKTRNFAASGEEELVRFMSPNLVWWGAARVLGLLNRQYFNGARNLATKPRDFTILPPHFWEDYPALLEGRGTVQDILAHAERLFAECRDLALASGLATPPAATFEDAMRAGLEPKD